MLKNEEKYTAALRSVLKKTDYAFFLRQLNGLSDFHDVWHDFDIAKSGIEQTAGEFKELIELLYLGIPQKKSDIAREAGEEELNLLLESGLWLRDGENIITDNYVIVVYQQLYVVVDIPPYMPTCTRKMTDVYIGSDSLRLGENVAFSKGTTVLDLCSGSGIQGLLAAKSADKVVCAEINERAVPVIRFNVSLNDFSNIIDVRCGDLYDVLAENEKFDFIYANPPFLPVPDGFSYPICGAVSEDDQKILRKIADGLFDRLTDRGEAIIYCEAFGDEESVFFDEYLMETCRKAGQEACWKVGQEACREASQETCRKDDEAKANAIQVTECRYNRIETALQTESMLRMSKLFDSNLDEAAFISGMNRIYEKAGAVYLYSLIYHIRPAYSAKSDIYIIDHCQKAESSPPGGRTDNAATYAEKIEMIESEIKLLEGILRKMKDA